jgi:heterotetrameric sarcosine oxidase gamma subunit
VASLIARTPFDGLLPLSHGTVEATEVVVEAMTSVAPFSGEAQAVSDALKSTVGCGLPPVGTFVEAKGTRVTWAGLDQWFVMGAEAVTVPGAALTDQGDAWAAVSVSGPGARDVLHRLVPIDLRPQVFDVGQAARTMLGHMSCLLLCVEPDRFLVLVFRSMAASATHDLDRAMRMVAARGAL